MEEEVFTLRDIMENREEIELHGQVFYLGLIEGHEVVLVQSGIGKVNAAIVVTLMKQIFDIEFVINTGSAGALDSALEVGDVLIAHSLAYHDVDVTAFGYTYGQMAGMPSAYYPDSELVRLAQESSREMGYEPYLGLIVSGDEFVSSNLSKEKILRHFPKARACEMESTAIAQSANVLQIPFLIIRAISDTAQGDANIDFDEFIITAGRNSALLVQKTLAKIPIQPPKQF